MARGGGSGFEEVQAREGAALEVGKAEGRDDAFFDGDSGAGGVIAGGQVADEHKGGQNEQRTPEKIAIKNFDDLLVRQGHEFFRRHYIGFGDEIRRAGPEEKYGKPQKRVDRRDAKALEPAQSHQPPDQAPLIE